MITPRSPPASGSPLLMMSAAMRATLKLDTRFRFTTCWNSSIGCGPSLDSVRLAMPPAQPNRRSQQQDVHPRRPLG